MDISVSENILPPFSGQKNLLKKKTIGSLEILVPNYIAKKTTLMFNDYTFLIS
jgi:hypothetical protein